MSTAPGTCRTTGADDAAAVYRAEYGRLVRLAFLLTGSHPAAEEVVQDAFVGLLRHWGRVDEPAAYVHRAVVNRARSHQRRRLLEIARTPRPVGVVPAPAEPDETWEALRRLPEAQRTVLVLRYYEDLTEPSIAALLNMPLGTVKSHVHRGLAGLRKALGTT